MEQRELDSRRLQDQLKEQVVLNPLDVQAHYQLASSYLQENNLDLAATEYEKVLELDPRNVTAHFDLGIILQRQGKLDEAIAQWQETVSLSPNFMRAHYNLGLLYEKIGQRERAITELQVALKILQNQKKILSFEMARMDDAEVCLLAYGCSSRVARSVMELARERGIRAGLLRLITVWP
ncbi:MAG: tetratricopeptide repeat protein, partial [Armatimonadetes bacterium]|nr:tetratricopeptide repeat protein [Armatimonadota bacterium]